MINIKGLDKAEVLAALYNASQPLGMGFLHFDPKPWTAEDAREAMGLGDDSTRMFGKTPSLRFDYLKGRVMKVDLTDDSFEEWAFDRDNGEGAAARAVDTIRPKEAQSA